MSTSSKDPKALTRLQFGILLAVLALCAAAALISVGSMVSTHGSCPAENQTSRPGNATCWVSYVNQDKTGVVGIAPSVAPSAAPSS